MTTRRRHNQHGRILDKRTAHGVAGPLSVTCPRESCQAQIGHRCRRIVGANWSYLKHPHPERKDHAAATPA